MQHDITHVVSGAKGAATVAAATVGIGIAEKIDILNGILGTVSLLLGIGIGVIVLLKRIIELRIEERKEKEYNRRKGDQDES